MKYNVFISYRRQGGFEVAKLIKEYLARDGYSVSFDLDNLRNGDFNTELLNRIADCEDFILILDKNVFDATIKNNKKKEKGDSDWLRTELAEALNKGKNVIPIMLTGFEKFPEELPSDIAAVRYKNGPKYDKEYFDAFYEKLKLFFRNSPDENIVIKNISAELECSIILEQGWLKYNNKRYDEAMEYFLHAAKLGSANALNAVAVYYKEGHGYENNPWKAFQWFRYSAELGYASAQRNLGDCYRDGYGVTKDECEAMKWYLRAAEKNNAKAQYAIAECYANGIGVDKDIQTAKDWYKKAADQGHEEAAEKLK